MKNTTRIGIVLAVSVAFFIVEIIVGFRTKSLALIADAFHYLNDIVAYVIAFAAAWLKERRKHTHEFTYAFHRAELVGAFFNGVFLLALALSIFLQSIERFVHLEEVEDPKLILIVGCIGLGLNIISIIVVHDHGHGHSHSANAIVNEDDVQTTVVSVDPDRHLHADHHHTLDPPIILSDHNLGLLGVLIHVLGDAVNNIGVMIVAIIIWKLEAYERYYADPAASLAISIVIFISAVPLTLRSGRILLEATPLHLNLEKIKEDLVRLPRVQSVHDLHVWHLSQSVILATLHVCVPSGTTLAEWEKTEQHLQQCFHEYGISHVTISPEIYRDSARTSTDDFIGCSSQDPFGCSVTDLKQRKVGV
ncbi:hypothetical protein CC1G_00879 [Coprinopsis cinerea okayama7|uniref:CDF zinc transporter n=1 Tax=Coprinopsis cinerea (strain Okayama-7 / 130 / ATCC MYA-4618 / FGSC 9003) TaxID=240176 RepID=A8N904_COPC7|nr:hypothetical protein CC1G_00879 [Coprinopsis cinerea okayama7\|eukprot:XP_001831332.1 hypothetical protein CC1G_00879 [Coprinopsis cinerea okayama7\